MNYSTTQDILYEFSESELAILTGDPTGTTINEDRICFARENADRLIDTYLRGVYNVPFIGETIYPVIIKLSVDLTIVFLYETAYRNSALPNTIVWRRIYAIKMLKDLRDGNITIMDLEGTIETPQAIISNKSEKNRLFSEDVLDKYS